MINLFKRFLAFMLVFSLIFNCFIIPQKVCAYDNSEPFFVEVSSENGITLRSGPGTKYDYLEQYTFNYGDCLSVIRQEQNEYGNIWYEVACVGGSGYIYQGNVFFHEHVMDSFCDTNGTEILQYCKCGFYQPCNTSEYDFLNSIALNGGYFLNPEILEALAALGSTMIEGASVAVPYLGIIVVAGMVIYISFNTSATQVVSLALSSEAPFEDFESTENGDKPYYKCYAPKKTKILYVRVDEPLSIEQASTYLEQYVGNSILSGHDEYYNIYTLNVDDATKLAQYFSKQGSAFAYGNSKNYFNPNGQMEVNMDSCSEYPQDGMFYHYHLYRRRNLYEYRKSKLCHLFFGYPVGYFSSM